MIYFTPEELKCHCGKCDSTGNEMNREFMFHLVELRKEAGFPFVISSAYRCPNHNASVSDTGIAGPHTTGKAIDIKVSESQAYQLIVLACIHEFSGIGIKQKGDINTRFIHLDRLHSPSYPRPRVWSY